MAIKKETLHPETNTGDDLYPRTSIDQVDRLEDALNNKVNKVDRIIEDPSFTGIDGYTYNERYTYGAYIVDRDPNTGLPKQTIQPASFYPVPYNSVRRNEKGEIILPNTITSPNSAVPKGFFKSSNTIDCNVSEGQINFSLNKTTLIGLFKNSDEIVFDIVLDWENLLNSKVQLLLANSVRNKIKNSLQLPTQNPTEQNVVTVLPNGSQGFVPLSQLVSTVSGISLYQYTVTIYDGYGDPYKYLSISFNIFSSYNYEDKDELLNYITNNLPVTVSGSYTPGYDDDRKTITIIDRMDELRLFEYSAIVNCSGQIIRNTGRNGRNNISMEIGKAFINFTKVKVL